jgi:hypothetical protein
LTFEEDFPHLKGKGLTNADTHCLNGVDNAFLAKDIQKYCLGKQKVQFAIDALLKSCTYPIEQRGLEDLKRELGLTELKTLEDLGNNPGTNYGVVHKDELKQEAIKWIKKWQTEQPNPQTDAEQYMMKGAKIDWVKHFFNISEDEL